MKIEIPHTKYIQKTYKGYNKRHTQECIKDYLYEQSKINQKC